jgi:hypothetical protein
LVCSSCTYDFKDFIDDDIEDSDTEKRIIVPDILLELELIDHEGYLLNGPSDTHRSKCLKKTQYLLDILNRTQPGDSYLFCSRDKNGVYISEDCISLVDNAFQHLGMKPSAQNDHLISALNVLFHPNRVIIYHLKLNYDIIKIFNFSH